MFIQKENRVIAAKAKKGRRMPAFVWTALEDMALTEPQTSVEFQALLQEKGWHEVLDRRRFLRARPIFDKEVNEAEEL